ncbi:hypothetical protein PsAD2_01827 [Pseudovibrio axinellae]|uniref:IrrE N-terminal-like domain-containing protein n=1 Tax=Pseudovibrio axinellae TaxID=989403 RepID=A0A165Z6B2_9HYPH|nr:ImmA/IrrE family metallo-endopeptidase [Pseudovibrio axinellae]KZL19549.1 hypothetical protein PsAD2_01827 [Pseudovibrio axinellae]SEQ31503.1 protein of unknown function [Pseudovibrio axinellae]
MTLEPQWASPPGDTILRMMILADIDECELASRIGISDDKFQKLMEGQLEISASLANALSTTLGSSERFWRKRYAEYIHDNRRLELAEKKTDLAEWSKQFPVSSLKKLGWLPTHVNRKHIGSEILNFFGCKDLHDWNSRYSSGIGAVAFRTSFAFEANELSTLAWLRTAEKDTENINLPSYSASEFQELLPYIKQLCAYKHPSIFLSKLQKACAETGVALVTSRTLEGCRASGASWRNANGNPIILLSFRYLSEDHFWFTFFHEAAHIVLHGGDHIDVDGTDPSPFGYQNSEAEADTFSQDILIEPELRAKILRTSLNRATIRSFARKAGITPGILVGQLQKLGTLRQNQFNDLKRRYRWESDPHVPVVR